MTDERATTREISWPTVIALAILVAGVVAVGLLVRRHERSMEPERNIGYGSHPFNANNLAWRPAP